MLKNFKQWTGEKMGKTHKARADETFNALADETEAQCDAQERLHDASQAYLKALSKRVEAGDKHKSLAIEMFGASMAAQSYTLREGSTYRSALQRMGDVHLNIGAAQSELISRFGSSYLSSLEKSQAQVKEYRTLQKKLHSRRIDYDAKLAKVQKAKKEKPEWEEEMQSAKAKYEETRECVLNMMADMNESQDENIDSLRSYYDAQLAYARSMVQILEAVPESTFVIVPGESHRKPFRQSSLDLDSDRPIYSDDQSSVHSVPTGRLHLDKAPSTADLRTHNTCQHSNAELSRSMSHLTPNAAQSRKIQASSMRMKTAPPPPPPNRPKQQKQVRALYNFEATADGELSLQKGDIVTIIEEIDEGWWEGELVDASGVRHEGMFPSNYCEEVFSDSGSVHRQESLSSNTSDPCRYMDEDEAAYYERESEPTVQYHEPYYEETTPSLPRRAPPVPTAPVNIISNNAMHNAPAGASARILPHQNRPVSCSSPSPSYRNSTIGSRAPPPPPPARKTACPKFSQGTPASVSPPPMDYSSPASPMPVPNPAPGGAMVGYLPRECIRSLAPDPADAQVRPCRECQCSDFAANVFKRGNCNNCFHAH